MTCVSERSGRASNAMWLIDQAPARIAAPVSASTMNRLRAEKEMIFSIIDEFSVISSQLSVRRLRSMDVCRRRLRRRLLFGGAVGRRRRHPGERGLEPRLRVDQE